MVRQPQTTHSKPAQAGSSLETVSALIPEQPIDASLSGVLTVPLDESPRRPQLVPLLLLGVLLAVLSISGLRYFSRSTQHSETLQHSENIQRSEPVRTIAQSYVAEHPYLREPRLVVGKVQESTRAYADWRKLLYRLTNVSTLNSPERTHLSIEFADFLKVHGEVLPDFLAQLSSREIAAGPVSSLFKVAIDALVLLGSTDAQAALLEIYRNPNCPPLGKEMILAALSATQAKLNSRSREFLLDESQIRPGAH